MRHSARPRTTPADPGRSLDAVADPDRTDRASRLVTESYGEREGYADVRFHGRRIGDRQVIVLHGEGIDDYDTGVFMRDVDHDEVLLIDQHRHDIQRGPDVEIQYGSAEADRLKRAFDDFRDRLAAADLADDYAAGFSLTRDSQDALAMVERVDGQEVLWIGVDTNGLTPDVRPTADARARRPRAPCARRAGARGGWSASAGSEEWGGGGGGGAWADGRAAEETSPLTERYPTSGGSPASPVRNPTVRTMGTSSTRPARGTDSYDRRWGATG